VPPSEFLGVPFGEYRLLGLLGEGGMARVYRAERTLPGGENQVAALKALPPSATARPSDLKALVNEARLGAYLEHANIVRTYEYGDVAGHWYMSMELVEGWSCWVLLTTCRRLGRPFPPSVLVGLARGVLQGLDHAHDRTDEHGEPLKIIHRDLKPGNILISKSGDVKLADFGVARAESNIYRTKTGEGIKGTLSYMSPEQLFGKRAALDHRSDLFAFGAVLVELATLAAAFRGAGTAETVDAINRVDAAATAAGVEERVPGLGPIVEKMLARAVVDRYSAASEALADLDAIADRLPTVPSIEDWLRSLQESLPPLGRSGDFGPDGPPDPVHESDASVSPADLPPLDTRAAARAPELVARAAPRVPAPSKPETTWVLRPPQPKRREAPAEPSVNWRLVAVGFWVVVGIVAVLARFLG
jgi:serine/threonine protein kinase